MTAITRRGAMLGATAAAVVAGVPSAVQGEDAALLAQVVRFHDLYDTWRDVWAKQQEHRARIEAMADCPPISPYSNTSAHFAFLEAHDAYKYCDESSRLGELAGQLANAIVETPARTFRGAVEKFKIAHLAVGSYEDDGDEGLEAYQDWDKPWMATVAADFERLLGGMRS